MKGEINMHFFRNRLRTLHELRSLKAQNRRELLSERLHDIQQRDYLEGSMRAIAGTARV